MRALVIDDSRTVRVIIGKILEELNIEVHQARDGLEALELLKTTPGIELMLVDWNMPRMDGLEFLRAVRAQRAYANVPILMVTSESEAEQVARALDAGATEYLMKPFTKEILVAKLGLLNVGAE